MLVSLKDFVGIIGAPQGLDIESDLDIFQKLEGP